MKNKFFLSLVFTILSQAYIIAGPGDTTWVQTFTFSSTGDPKTGTFVFPPDSIEYSKILMFYKLKCNPAQNPQCGEWDYLTYTHLMEHTGNLDSSLYYHPNYMVNGASPDSFRYMFQPSFLYNPYFEYYINYLDTISLNTYLVGDGNYLNNNIISGNEDTRAVFLWDADEMLASGIQQGTISGIKIFVKNTGNEIKKFRVSVKVLNDDTLNYSNAFQGFQEVYVRNISINDTGWVSIPFTNSIQWDGVSNIAISFAYENPLLLSYQIKNDTSAEKKSFVSVDKDNFISMDGADNIHVPSSVFQTINNEISISFWQYGDATLPQDNSAFEAVDSLGQRVLNVHLPWSNGRVYWDAGSVSNSYDRIDQATASQSQYKEKWNHWAFTKNATTGNMKIYLNGDLFQSGTGKVKPINTIRDFVIGQTLTFGPRYYTAFLDEFMIWDKELSQQQIKDIMYSNIDASFPDYNNLKAYYTFDNDSLNVLKDKISSFNNALAVGLPELKSYNGVERFKRYTHIDSRPTLVFEKGVFSSRIDSVLRVDTIRKQPLSLVLFNNLQQPNIATDTLIVWEHYYNYSINSQGIRYDSVLVNPDATIHLIQSPYYGHPYEVINRYELGRFITPYGNNLDMGTGWTWVYDVSDFRPLLKDSVSLRSGNWQELLDLKFALIQGTPSRKVLKIENVWNGDFALSTFNDNIQAKTIQLDTAAKQFRLRACVTGHQFSNTTNCAEFCSKIHSVKVNDITQWNWQIIQSCSMNPLYPQGGTWIYDRAGWCPGMPGKEYLFELTPFVSNHQIKIDYEIESDLFGNYVTETQLVSYAAPHFTLDAEMDDIIAPNNGKIYGRFNPICGKPIVKIKNNGTTTLNSADILYGITGTTPSTYHWTGTLVYLDTQIVILPQLNGVFSSYDTTSFFASITNPNGGSDEYLYNNSLKSIFSKVKEYNINKLIFNYKTNNASSETSWNLSDVDGNILKHNPTLQNNTIYKDTFSLSDGCYQLTINDAGGDGLKFWANMPPYGSGTAGYAILKRINNAILNTFQPDFGSQIRLNFRINTQNGIDDEWQNLETKIFPNPTSDILNIEPQFDLPINSQVSIFNALGVNVYKAYIINYSTEIDLRSFDTGLYTVLIQQGKEVLSRIKFVIAR